MFLCGDCKDLCSDWEASQNCHTTLFVSEELSGPGSLHSKQTPVLPPGSKQGHPSTPHPLNWHFDGVQHKGSDPDVRLLLVDLENVFLTLVSAVYIFLEVKLQRFHIFFCSWPI